MGEIYRSIPAIVQTHAEANGQTSSNCFLTSWLAIPSLPLLPLTDCLSSQKGNFKSPRQRKIVIYGTISAQLSCNIGQVEACIQKRQTHVGRVVPNVTKNNPHRPIMGIIRIGRHGCICISTVCESNGCNALRINIGIIQMVILLRQVVQIQDPVRFTKKIAPNRYVIPRALICRLLPLKWRLKRELIGR